MSVTSTTLCQQIAHLVSCPIIFYNIYLEIFSLLFVEDSCSLKDTMTHQCLSTNIDLFS